MKYWKEAIVIIASITAIVGIFALGNQPGSTTVDKVVIDRPMQIHSVGVDDSSKTEEKDEVSTQKYKIYYETKFLHHRGNVGSEWGFYLKDGSNIIESGDSISAKGNLELTAVAVEYDDSSNDIGTATIKIAHAEDFPMIKTVNVTVKERYGKDAGSTAEIKFTIKIVKE